MALSKTSSQPTPRVVGPEMGDFPVMEQVLMDVDPEAMRFIIDRLTDVTQFPAQYAVRETVSNAIDAVLRAGKRGTVSITTPTENAPLFIVEDEGTGMSTEDVRQNYRYGGSSKRNDLSQVGAYGLGAKAPLAYCKNFHGATTQDGVTTIFEAVRGDMGNIINILSVQHTGNASGTRITVPVRTEDIYKFEQAIDVYRKYATDLDITIDGEPISPLKDYLLVDDIMLDEETDTRGRVWMSKNAITNGYLSAILRGSARPEYGFLLSGWHYAGEGMSNTLLVELRPGVVDFSSSRDEITDNERLRVLKQRVVKKFGMLTESLFRNLLKTYRQQMDLAVAWKFCSVILSHSSVSPNGDISLSLRDGAIILGMDDFTMDSGQNPMKDFILGTKSKGYALAYSNDSGYTCEVVPATLVELNKNQFCSSHITGKVTEVTERLKQHVESNMLLSLTTLFGAVFKAKYSASDVLVITGVDEDYIDFFAKHRPTHMRDLFPNFVLTFSKDVPTKDELELWGAMTRCNIEVISASTLRQEVVDYKAANRTNKTAKGKKDTLFTFTQLFKNITAPEKVSFNHHNSALQRMTIEEFKATGSLLIIVAPYSASIKKSFYGMCNDGLDVKGRDIYYIPVRELNAAAISALVDYEFVTVQPGAKYKCKDFAKLPVRSGDVLFSEINNLTPQQVLQVVKEDFGMYYHRLQILSHLAPMVENNEDLKKALDFLGQTPDQSAAARFGGNGSKLLRRHVTEEQALMVENVLKYVVGLLSQRNQASFMESVWSQMFLLSPQNVVKEKPVFEVAGKALLERLEKQADGSKLN